MSSSKWHAWFASRCPGKCLSTWPTIAVSCPTALGALCSQLTFLLVWRCEHSTVMATVLLQPRDLTCGTLLQSSCIILTSPMDCSDDSWKDTFFRKHEHGALWLPICGTIDKHLLTWMLQYTHTHLTSLFLGLPRWAGTRKVKPMWILQKQETVSGSGISWPICKSAPCSRQTTTPAPHHTVCYGPDALPATQPTESKHWRQLNAIVIT